MEEFIQLFGNLLAFVYPCFDRMVIHGCLSGLSRPEQVVYFVRQVLGLPVVSKEVLSQRTGDYRDWVEAYAHVCSPPRLLPPLRLRRRAAKALTSGQNVLRCLRTHRIY
ncbi:MAG: hypothetical protein WCA20_12715 [Candidatus Sulfotelmatobacter sp.]